MKVQAPQNYDNHRVFDLVYLSAGIFWCAAVLAFAASLVPGLSLTASMLILRIALFFVLISTLIMLIKIRLYPLKLQNRIIRLEMRVRLRQLLPPDDHWQIRGLSIPQLIGLRFASDEELPALARKVLDEGITDRDAVKRLVKTWTADHDRI